ncbi:hypothetical protein KY285_007711 [Solanum tuberosum]|nr:hypothetical protein KY285_007711 [Solanum tuberosum]
MIYVFRGKITEVAIVADSYSNSVKILGCLESAMMHQPDDDFDFGRTGKLPDPLVFLVAHTSDMPVGVLFNVGIGSSNVEFAIARVIPYKEIYFGSFKHNPSMTSLTFPPSLLNALPTPRVRVVSPVRVIPSFFPPIFVPPDKVPLDLVDSMAHFTGDYDVLHNMGGDATKGGFGQDSPSRHV